MLSINVRVLHTIFANSTYLVPSGPPFPVAGCVHQHHCYLLHGRAGGDGSSQGLFSPRMPNKIRFNVYPLAPWRQSVSTPSVNFTLMDYVDKLFCSSFFQGLCVLGYCIAPLDIAALIACFVRVIYIRAPIALLAWAWSIWGMFPSHYGVYGLFNAYNLASVNFLDGTKIDQQRILLAVYPLL